jgi:hypothetical protein
LDCIDTIIAQNGEKGNREGENCDGDRREFIKRGFNQIKKARSPVLECTPVWLNKKRVYVDGSTYTLYGAGKRT